MLCLPCECNVQASFSPADFKKSMTTPDASYICGGSLLWVDEMYTPDPSVPINTAAIERYAVRLLVALYVMWGCSWFGFIKAVFCKFLPRHGPDLSMSATVVVLI